MLVELDGEHTKCSICFIKFSSDRDNEDPEIRQYLPVLSSSQRCDHWFCHGCVLREQLRVAEENNGRVPKWIKCMHCRENTSFNPAEPKYHRLLIDLLARAQKYAAAQVKTDDIEEIIADTQLGSGRVTSMKRESDDAVDDEAEQEQELKRSKLMVKNEDEQENAYKQLVSITKICVKGESDTDTADNEERDVKEPSSPLEHVKEEPVEYDDPPPLPESAPPEIMQSVTDSKNEQLDVGTMGWSREFGKEVLKRYQQQEERKRTREDDDDEDASDGDGEQEQRQRKKKKNNRNKNNLSHNNNKDNSKDFFSTTCSIHPDHNHKWKDCMYCFSGPNFKKEVADKFYRGKTKTTAPHWWKKGYERRYKSNKQAPPQQQRGSYLVAPQQPTYAQLPPAPVPQAPQQPAPAFATSAAAVLPAPVQQHIYSTQVNAHKNGTSNPNPKNQQKKNGGGVGGGGGGGNPKQKPTPENPQDGGCSNCQKNGFGAWFTHGTRGCRTYEVDGRKKKRGGENHQLRDHGNGKDDSIEERIQSAVASAMRSFVSSTSSRDHYRYDRRERTRSRSRSRSRSPSYHRRSRSRSRRGRDDY